MDNMKKCNYVISAVTACLGAAIMIASARLSLAYTASGPGAGFWPMILGGIFLFSAAALLVLTIKKGEELIKIPVVLGNPANKRVYMTMGIITIYCVLLNLTGFYIATCLFIPTVMYLMDERNLKKLIITPISVIAVIYVVFGILLRTKLPTSIFFQ